MPSRKRARNASEETKDSAKETGITVGLWDCMSLILRFPARSRRRRRCVPESVAGHRLGGIRAKLAPAWAPRPCNVFLTLTRRAPVDEWRNATRAARSENAAFDQKKAANPGGFRVLYREASNRVDRSHSR